MNDRITQTEYRSILRANATHKEIQSAVTGYLKDHGIPYSETDATESFNRYGQRVRRVKKGWPDIVACLPPDGLCLPIEIKTAKDKLRPEQARTLHALYMAGALVCIARSVDDLIETLEKGNLRGCDLAEICRYKDKLK